MQEKDSLETAGEGSGVIYKKDNDTAYVVTNNHVIDGSDAIEVILKDGRNGRGICVAIYENLSSIL